jgi:teichoic acid transport system permease protein
VTSTDVPPLVRLGGKPGIGEYIRSLWTRREFALAIPRAELRAKNQNTVLGGLWHVLNPLMLVGVYYVVFDLILDTSRGVENFLAFLTIGVFVFHLTSKSVNAASKSITSNEGLLRAVAFPRAILPLSVVLSEFLAFSYALIVMVAVVLLTGEPLYWTWVLIVPAIALQLLFNAGLALFVARLTSHFRDVSQVLPYLLRMWLYFSGVLYEPTHFVAEGSLALRILQANPAYVYINLVRTAVLEQKPPPAMEWIEAAAWGTVVLVIGFLYFRAREHEYGRG